MNAAKASSEPLGAVILVGNPNVGKSVVFGALTGRYVNVSNYPGTTVEVTRGEARDRGITLEVIDTPGVYSLLPMSEDERVTRDILMREPGARVLQVCDAKNMRRSLMITAQLAEMELPLVLAVNMADEARERGVMPRLETLGERLGVPAVPTVAVRKKGTDRLLTLLEHPSPSSVRIDYGIVLEAAILRMEGLLPEHAPIGKRALAIMLLCGDDSLAPWLSENVSASRIREMNDVRNRLMEESGEEIAFRVNRARLSWIDRLLVDLGVEASVPSSRIIAQAFGRYAMDPVYGFPILLGVLALAYEFVGVFGAGYLVDLLQKSFFEGWIIPSIAAFLDRFVPSAFLRDFLVGPY
ncbi:MAG: FeoB small GTPase domain-containing protein, partial [bacterium]|nr:FeoB small GTPase domain-containing protein [bacterium]